MINIRYITPYLRKELKKPLGTLLHGSAEEIVKILKTMIEKENPAKIVTVGDRVSQDLTDYCLTPDVLIVDNRIMRKEIQPIPATADKVIEIMNPPGTITDEAWLAVEKAMTNPNRTKIVVEGEEDLLTLVSILAVPENSLVLYGQPRKGVVAVKTTQEMKQKVQKIIETMKSD